MKNILFTAMGLEASVPDNFYYFDDGYVDDVHAHAKLLDEKYRCPPRAINASPNVRGRTMVYNQILPLKRSVHIFYLRQDDSYTDTRTRAHEEGHAMQEMGVLDVLQGALRDNGFTLNLHDFDTETVTSIAGWFPYISSGQMPERYTPINEDDERALEILKESKKKLKLR